MPTCVVSSSVPHFLLGVTHDGAFFVQRLEAHFGRTVARSLDDDRAIDNLKSFAGRQARVCAVPRLLDDVYDFEGLLAINGHLFGLESAG